VGRKNVLEAMFRSRALTSSGQDLLGDLAYHGLDASSLSTASLVSTNGMPNSRGIGPEIFFLSELMDKIYYHQNPNVGNASQNLAQYIENQKAEITRASEEGTKSGQRQAAEVKTETPKGGWTVFVGISSGGNPGFSMAPFVGVTLGNGAGISVSPSGGGVTVSPIPLGVNLTRLRGFGGGVMRKCL